MINPEGNIIWVVSYPKSGNTWVRLFLHFILNRMEGLVNTFPSLHEIPIASNRLLFDEYLGVNSSDLTNEEISKLRPLIYREASRNSEGMALFKVHDAFGYTVDGNPIFPPDVTRAAVYIVRNPLDVAVSYSYHTGRSLSSCVHSLNDPGYSIASMGQDFKAQVPQHLGSWSDHVNSWINQTSIPAVMVKYEDLLSDSEKEFLRILEQLDIRYTNRGFEFAQKNCDFKHLQSLELRHGFREKPIQSKKFFREGKKGIYHEKLDPAQIKEICNKHQELMNRFGYLI